MKITNTEQLLEFIEKSDKLSLKINLGGHLKPLWCPTFEAQWSKRSESISDSISETFASLDCHLRNLNSVSEVEGSSYGNPHILIGTKKAGETSNITPELIERLVIIMRGKWEDKWAEEKRQKQDWQIEKYGSDCFSGFLLPRPYEMKILVNDRLSRIKPPMNDEDLFGDGLGIP